MRRLQYSTYLSIVLFLMFVVCRCLVENFSAKSSFFSCCRSSKNAAPILVFVVTFPQKIQFWKPGVKLATFPSMLVSGKYVVCITHTRKLRITVVGLQFNLVRVLLLPRLNFTSFLSLCSSPQSVICISTGQRGEQLNRICLQFYTSLLLQETARGRKYVARYNILGCAIQD